MSSLVPSCLAGLPDEMDVLRRKLAEVSRSQERFEERLAGAQTALADLKRRIPP